MNHIFDRFGMIVFCTCICVILLVTQVSSGGTRRHDTQDSSYLNLAAEYPSVGRLDILHGETGDLHDSYGSGILISDSWVLTAGHNVDKDYDWLRDLWKDNVRLSDLNEHSRFKLDPSDVQTSYKFSKMGTGLGVILNDDWNGRNPTEGGDLALIRLSKPVKNAVPAEIYRGSAEIGSEAVITGFGVSGDGESGWDYDNYPGGTKRAGRNVIDIHGNQYESSWNERLLVCDFDNPDGSVHATGSSTAKNMEYHAGPGDSGGGIFIDIEGKTYLAGVNSFLYDDTWGAWAVNGKYNEITVATRVSSHTSP